MTEWIDLFVFAALLLIVWFVLPAMGERFTRSVMEDRNPRWFADQSELALRVAPGRWFGWSAYVLGTLSIGALLAVQLGFWWQELSAPVFEPAQWMVLSDLFTALVVIWLVHFGIGTALFARRLKSVVPLAERRQASLQRRSVDAFVPRPLRLLIYALVSLHLIAWLIVGGLGLHSTPAFWGTLTFQFAIALILVLAVRAVVERRPNAMDRIFGTEFRRTEVRVAFVAQLLPLFNGGARLYEAVNGAVMPDIDRVSRLGLVVLIIVSVVAGIVRFSRSSRTGSDRDRAGGTPRNALALLLALLAAASSSPALAQTPPATVPVDADIRSILVDRVDTHRQTLGIVVGIIDPSGRRVIAHGRRAKDDSRPIDGDTVFELASITKVFTSLLLTDAVGRGEVALADPVNNYLPAHVKVPSRGGRHITLLDLATHMSGLPREPSNLRPKDPSNPFADYSVTQLYEFLSSHQLAREIGTEFDYSNLGAGLLGHVLALRAGTDYGALVRARITGPLGMTNTDVSFSPAMRAQLAVGHNRAFEPVPNWDSPTLAGAGALRSTANDMLRFLAAALGYDATPLRPALAAMSSTRRATSSPAFESGLGWGILRDRGTEIRFANGRSGGYRTWIGFEPRLRIGVVVLTNTDDARGPDDIGMHLLNPAFPLQKTFPPPLTSRLETKVDAAVFDRYVGRYQFAPSVVLTVSRNADRFFGEITGQPPFEMFAENEKTYFLKATDAQLTFETDATDGVKAVVLRQNGANQRAPRVEGEPAMPKEIALSAELLERYVGRYQIAPGVILIISRTDTRLFAQVAGAPPLEAFASTEREFFHKTVNVQLTFEVDGQNRANAVVVHQNGLNHRAVRVE